MNCLCIFFLIFLHFLFVAIFFPSENRCTSRVSYDFQIVSFMRSNHSCLFFSFWPNVFIFSMLGRSIGNTPSNHHRLWLVFLFMAKNGNKFKSQFFTSCRIRWYVDVNSDQTPHCTALFWHKSASFKQK